MDIVWHKLRRLIIGLALVSLVVPAQPSLAESHAGGGNLEALHSLIHIGVELTGLAGVRADKPAMIDCCAFPGAGPCAIQGAGCCTAGATALPEGAPLLAIDTDPGPVWPRRQNRRAAHSLASDPPPPRI